VNRNIIDRHASNRVQLRERGDEVGTIKDLRSIIFEFFVKFTIFFNIALEGKFQGIESTPKVLFCHQKR
jgi:hypothetical protein